MRFFFLFAFTQQENVLVGVGICAVIYMASIYLVFTQPHSKTVTNGWRSFVRLALSLAALCLVVFLIFKIQIFFLFGTLLLFLASSSLFVHHTLKNLCSEKSLLNSSEKLYNSVEFTAVVMYSIFMWNFPISLLMIASIRGYV